MFVIQVNPQRVLLQTYAPSLWRHSYLYNWQPVAKKTVSPGTSHSPPFPTKSVIAAKGYEAESKVSPDGKRYFINEKEK